MNSDRVGRLLFSLRRESGMTQKQLGELLGVSDKAVSKWEKGRGCPDITFLNTLADIFQVDIDRILGGSLEPNEADKGDIRKLHFYVCPGCKNIMTSISGNELSCCGRKLHPLKARSADEKHRIVIEEIEQDYFVTFQHEMVKEHYISFIAYVAYERVLLVRLYPEQGSEVRFPAIYGGVFYYYCVNHGLWEVRYER